MFSDIHGNCVSLDAILSDLKTHQVDKVVCLGDAVQGGSQPREVVSRLRELACPVIMGNADAWLLDATMPTREPVSEEQLTVREWSLTQLTNEDREFIKRFKPAIQVSLADRYLLCFHGSPNSFDDIILPTTPEDEFEKLLKDYRGFVLCGGHTHVQQVRRIGDSLFFNPGSVGVAYSRNQSESIFRADPWAEYAVLTSDENRLALEFRRVPIDVKLLVETILSSGRPFAEKAASMYRGRFQDVRGPLPDPKSSRI